MNLDDMISALIARADKRRQDGLKDGDSVDADKIKALKAIIAWVLDKHPVITWGVFLCS